MTAFFQRRVFALCAAKPCFDTSAYRREKTKAPLFFRLETDAEISKPFRAELEPGVTAASSGMLKTSRQWIPGKRTPRPPTRPQTDTQFENGRLAELFARGLTLFSSHHHDKSCALSHHHPPPTCSLSSFTIMHIYCDTHSHHLIPRDTTTTP